MGIGEEFAKQAQERSKQEKIRDEAFGTGKQPQVDYFSSEPDEALKKLTEDNWNNPLHWTQVGKHIPLTDDQEVKVFLSKDTQIKTVDDFFK